MIRILYLIGSLDHGGTEKQLIELMIGLDPDRFEVHLCTLKPSKGLYEDLDKPKFCLHFDSFLKPSIAGVLKRLVGYIRKNNIDIVQCFFQDPFVLAALAKPFSKVRLVGSFRDLGFWRNSRESFKMRLAEKAFDAFLANSQAVKEHFCQVDGLNPEKVGVIYNGFDLSRLERLAPSKRYPDSPVIGIVANLNRPVKRVQDFIATAVLIRQQVSDARFVVVGDGYLRGDLEQMAAGLGLTEGVSFVGSQPNPLDFVKDFSIGVITSETEGFSNAVIEYMACGVPVVASATGGNVELVEDGVNGHLVPVGDVEQFAEKVIRLLDVSLNLKVAENNRDFVSTRLSLPIMLKEYEDFYQSLK